MNLKSIMFLIILCILDRVLAKKAPHFYKKMDLPINILFSLLMIRVFIKMYLFWEWIVIIIGF